jgi:hypothetical protein
VLGRQVLGGLGESRATQLLGVGESSATTSVTTTRLAYTQVLPTTSLSTSRLAYSSTSRLAYSPRGVRSQGCGLDSCHWLALSIHCTASLSPYTAATQDSCHCLTISIPCVSCVSMCLVVCVCGWVFVQWLGRAKSP